MLTVWILVIAVLTGLVLERVTISRATARPAGREWIIRHRLFHPNSISFIRMPMGLISVGLWHVGCPAMALLWFAGWMITDLTDGTIARNCDLQTESGKWLDPLSDKAMYFPVLIYFTARGILDVNWLWVAALLVIDGVGQGSRILVKKKAANSFGKAKTAFITILLSVVALAQIGQLPFVTPKLQMLLTLSCVLLASLSLYCKVIPDSWYANSLTFANFMCGVLSIWCVYQGHPVRAFVLVFLGQFFDLFDGRMARKFGSTRYGAIFDDIADGTSFGLAIGYLLQQRLATSWAGDCIAVLYVLCVIYRLIRFLLPSVKMPPGIFQGLPSPAGAMLAGSGALLFDELPVVGLGIALGASYLMISSIPYRHFGQKIWPDLPNMAKLLILVVFLALVNVAVADKNYVGAFSLISFVLILVYATVCIDWRWWRVMDEPKPEPS